MLLNLHLFTLEKRISGFAPLRFLILLLCYFAPGLFTEAAGQSAFRPFITTWRTASDNQSISIPAFGENYSILWEKIDEPSVNGNATGNNTTAVLLPKAGDYRISISPGTGTFTEIRFREGGSRASIQSIDQWGDLVWGDMAGAFFGCKNLVNHATDIPDLSEVTSMRYMFSDASAFSADLSGWDVSNVTNMQRMFDGATAFNADLSSWDVSNVTTMESMFHSAAAFNSDLSNWNVGKVTDMSYMFFGASIFNSDLSSWNVSKVTNMMSMFTYATAFNQSLGKWILAADFTTSGLFEIFRNAGIGCKNYTKTLIGWAGNPAGPTDITFSNPGLKYGPAAVAARATLVGKRWSITDNGLDANCILSTQTVQSGAWELTSTWQDQDVPDARFNATILAGHVIALNGSGTFKNLTNQGTLQGNGSLTGHVTNGQNGTIAIRQSPACMTINGNLTNQGTLSVGVTGTTACTDFSKLTITGTATLSGKLLVSIDYTPVNGDVITILKAGSLTGTFGTVPALPNDWHLIYNYPTTGEISLKYAVPLRPFITTWRTTADNEEISIPGVGSGYSILWEKIDEPAVKGNATGDNTTAVLLPKAGDYRVSISPGVGTFTQIRFRGGGSRTKIRSIDQWGEIAWSDMDGAFYECENLISLATDSPDLSEVTSTRNMFSDALAFNADLSNWDVSTVTSMQRMFNGATSFNGDLSSWNVNNVTTMEGMFYNAAAFNGNLSNWEVGNVTDVSFMFFGASAFRGDLSSWSVGNVTNMTYMFAYAAAFSSDLHNWDVRKVTNMESLFYNASSFSSDLSGWVVDNVTNMINMFSGATAFHSDLSSWDVSKVTNMSRMFWGATTFSGNVSSWEVSNVTNMGGMFFEAAAFHSDLSNWTVNNVTDMSRMFWGAAVFNSDLSGWDVSKVTNMTYMFMNAAAFNSDLSSWDVGKVTDMTYMFSGATVFNGGLSSWKVGKVTNMSFMFSDAVAFNRDLNKWDVSKVTDMKNMFTGATSFNQSLGKWILAADLSTSALSGILQNTGIGCENYSKTLIGWAGNPALPSNITFINYNLKYGPAAVAARTILTGKGWSIADNGLDADCSIATETAQSGTWNLTSTWHDLFLPDDAYNATIMEGHVITLGGNAAFKTLTNRGTLQGEGSMTGHVTNETNGTIAPGQSPGCMSINGNLDNKGTISIEVDGTTACTDFDKMTINGTAILNGALQISINYTPVNGDMITFLNAESLSGTFNTVSSLPENWWLVYNHPNTGELSLLYTTNPLPVKLITFTGRVQERGIALLQWETTAETNNKGFYIEKSRDVLEWSTLGFIPGKGDGKGLKRYSFRDNNFGDIAYYRLKQVDADGTYTHSRFISLQSQGTGTNLTLYPNPAKEKLKFSGLPSSPVEVRISDLAGRPLILLPAGFPLEEGIDVRRLPAGIYTIELKGKVGKTVKKFVKE